jgi:hypothetical protein
VYGVRCAEIGDERQKWWGCSSDEATREEAGWVS